MARSNEELVQTTVRLPGSIENLWERTARRVSQNKTATLIMAIRLLAKSEGVPMPDDAELGIVPEDLGVPA